MTIGTKFKPLIIKVLAHLQLKPIYLHPPNHLRYHLLTLKKTVLNFPLLRKDRAIKGSIPLFVTSVFNVVTMNVVLTKLWEDIDDILIASKNMEEIYVTEPQLN